MMRNRVVARVAVAVGVLALSGPAWAAGEKIPSEKLPEAVREALKAKFLKAEITRAVKEGPEGKILYQVLLRDAGQPIDVALKADGTILEVGKKVSLKRLPRAVRKSLAARYPKAKFGKIKAVSRGGGPMVYEVVVEHEVALNADGEIEGAEEMDAETEENDEKMSDDQGDDEDGNDEDEDDEDGDEGDGDDDDDDDDDDEGDDDDGDSGEDGDDDGEDSDDDDDDEDSDDDGGDGCDGLASEVKQ